LTSGAVASDTDSRVPADFWLRLTFRDYLNRTPRPTEVLRQRPCNPLGNDVMAALGDILAISAGPSSVHGQYTSVHEMGDRKGTYRAAPVSEK
jgi:hypothetical protein